jgi:hypothetical protein
MTGIKGRGLISSDQSGTPAVTIPADITLLDSYALGAAPTDIGGIYRITDGPRGFGTGNGLIAYPISPFIDPRNFGAVCDGATDDSAALQDAFDAATPGSLIYLPSNMAIAAAVTFDGDGREGCKLIGADYYGGTATLKWTGAAGGSVLTILDARGIQVSGIFINGDGVAANGLMVLSDNAPGSYNNTFENVAIIGCTTAGITVDGVADHNAQVSELRFTNVFLLDNVLNYWQRTGNAYNINFYDSRMGDSAFSGPNTGATVVHNIRMDAGGLRLYGVNFEGVKNAVGSSDIHVAGFNGFLEVYGAYSETTRPFMTMATSFTIPTTFIGVNHTPATATLDAGETVALRVISTSQFNLIGCRFTAGDISVSNDAMVLNVEGTSIAGDILVDGGGAAPSLHMFRTSGSMVWDAPAIGDGAQAGAAAAVTGVQLGDKCVPSASISLQGLILSAYVSSDGNVTWLLGNVTGAPVDLGSATYRVDVWRQY